MNRRQQATLLACAISVLLAGAAIGASIVATHHTPAPTVSVDDGAIDFAAEQPVAP
jgi:hypothetical protein